MKAFKKTLSVLLSLVLAVTGLVGLCVPAGATNVGDIILFGNYPQTKVSETTTLKNAANAATWNSYGYYIGTDSNDADMAKTAFMKYADFVSGGVKYRAVRFSNYRPLCTSWSSNADNSRQYDNGYFINTTYYFKYEPLEWRVLDPSTGLVLCEALIDAQAFQNLVRLGSGNTYYFGSSSLTYANNYASSSIRDWLNEEFYNTAFNAAQKSKIESVLISNKAFSDEYSKYNSAWTENPIFLLSYSEAQNSSYGLSSESARKAKGTDYAKCQGLMYRRDTGFSRWWLRTAGDYSNGVCNVESGGAFYIGGSANFNDYGVRPACYLSDLTADTSQDFHTVTATASPTAGGTVTGGGTYNDGQSATVTATNNSGYLFSGWYKGSTKVSSNKSYTFTVTENVTLTAKFTKRYTVTVTANPTAGGTVTGGGTYTDGKTATVTATANSGYLFSGWYKGSTKVSSNKSYTFTVTENVTLTAKFSKLSMSYTVTATAYPAEGGSVSGGGSYSAGETATVTATPNSGWHFSGWYTDSAKVSSNKSYSFPVTGSVTLIAKFEKDSYTITVSADPAEGGTVTGSGSYSKGTLVTLNAIPNSGWHFVGWYNGSIQTSSSASDPHLVIADVTLTAKFEKDADPGQPENPDNGNGSNEPAANLCKWCGKDHSDGFFQKIVAFFHNIFAKLFGAKFKPDGTPVQK